MTHILESRHYIQTMSFVHKTITYSRERTTSLRTHTRLCVSVSTISGGSLRWNIIRYKSDYLYGHILRAIGGAQVVSQSSSNRRGSSRRTLAPGNDSTDRRISEIPHEWISRRSRVVYQGSDICILVTNSSGNALLPSGPELSHQFPHNNQNL